MICRGLLGGVLERVKKGRLDQDNMRTLNIALVMDYDLSRKMTKLLILHGADPNHLQSYQPRKEALIKMKNQLEEIKENNIDIASAFMESAIFSSTGIRLDSRVMGESLAQFLKPYQLIQIIPINKITKKCFPPNTSPAAANAQQISVQNTEHQM